MENLNHKQDITEQVRLVSCPSCSSDEGRLAMGLPDPSTTLRWRERGEGGEDSVVNDVGSSLPPSRLDYYVRLADVSTLSIRLDNIDTECDGHIEWSSLHSTGLVDISIERDNHVERPSIRFVDLVGINSEHKATSSDRQPTPPVSSALKVSARRFAGLVSGLRSFVAKDVKVGDTASSNEHQLRELARTRATYDNFPSVGWGLIPVNDNSRHLSVINSDSLIFHKRRSW